MRLAWTVFTGLDGLLQLPEFGSFGFVDYEWDEVKNAQNLRKHGVDFMDAIAALEDPNRVEDIDTRHDYGEERVDTIGIAQGRVLFVVTTIRE